MIQGLEKGEKCLFIIEESTAISISHFFKDKSNDLKAYIESGQYIILSKEESCLKDGYFDPDLMIELLKSNLQQALDEGYSGLRVTDEMTWVFSNLPGVGRLMEYEAKLNEFIPDSRITAICQYNENRFTPKVLIDVLKTHPKVFLYGDYYRNNHYESPDVFLAQLEGRITRDIFHNTVNDIKIFNETEKALLESENKHRRLFETMTQGVIYQAADGRIISVNPAAERILGLTFDQMQSKTLMDPRWQMIEEDGTAVSSDGHPAMIALRTGQTVGPVIRGVYRPDSKDYIWLNITAIPLFHPGETKSFLVYSTLEDITKHKQAEDLLEFKRDQMFSIFDSLKNIVYISDPQTYEILFVNKFMQKSFNKELVGGICYRELQHKEQPCDFCTNDIIINRQGKPYRWEYYNHILERYFLITDQIIKWPDGRDVRFEMAIDITDRKELEEALSEREKKYRLLAENAEDVIWTLDNQFQFTYISPSIQKLRGLTPKEAMQERIEETMTPESYERVAQRIRETLESEAQGRFDIVSKLQIEQYHKDGSTVWVETLSHPLLDEQGRKIGYLGLSRNITDRKQAEEKLILSEARLRLAAESSGLGLWEWRVDLDKVIVSDYWLKLKGICREDYNQSIDQWADGLHPEDRDHAIDLLDSHLRGEIDSFQTVYRFMRPGRGWYWEEAAAKVIDRDADGKPLRMVGYHKDITDRKRIEEELIASRKQLEETYCQLEEEVNKAVKIHKRLLPAELPQTESISIAAHYQPAERMGGDAYNVIRAGNNLIVYVSDVMGHGLDGAMISVFIKEAIDSYVNLKPDEISPQKILRHLSNQYCSENYPDEQYICIFLGALDLETNELKYSSAGMQNNPIVRMGDGEKVRLNTEGIFIGNSIPVEMLIFEEKTLSMTPGTTVMISTDGLLEQDNGEEWFIDLYEDIFYENSCLPPKAIIQAMNKDFCLFNNNSLVGTDDITYLVLQVNR